MSYSSIRCVSRRPPERWAGPAAAHSAARPAARVPSSRVMRKVRPRVEICIGSPARSGSLTESAVTGFNGAAPSEASALRNSG